MKEENIVIEELMERFERALEDANDLIVESRNKVEAVAPLVTAVSMFLSGEIDIGQLRLAHKEVLDDIYGF